jgi:hypothetical protein
MDKNERTPSVCMDAHIRMPSSWKDAVGAVLTDKRIRFYQERGRYGPYKAPAKKTRRGLPSKSRLKRILVEYV